MPINVKNTGARREVKRERMAESHAAESRSMERVVEHEENPFMRDESLLFAQGGLPAPPENPVYHYWWGRASQFGHDDHQYLANQRMGPLKAEPAPIDDPALAMLVGSVMLGSTGNGLSGGGASETNYLRIDTAIMMRCSKKLHRQYWEALNHFNRKRTKRNDQVMAGFMHEDEGQIGEVIVDRDDYYTPTDN